MLSIIMPLFFPIILVWISAKANKNTKRSKGETLVRYFIYTMVLWFVSTIMIELLKDDNTSIYQKVNQSVGFAIKYSCLQILLVIGLAVSEWLLLVKGYTYQSFYTKIMDSKTIVIFRKYMYPIILYIIAAVVVILNFSLMFDNVVWGDEAFSANVAPNNMYGIMQILYYLDNHPPLHYFWIKLFGDVFGHTVSVYHFASLVPFLVGIVMAVTLFKKYFSTTPALILVIFLGLSASCVEYNLEIRMYSLAFCGVLGTFYCAYSVLNNGKCRAWIGMVLWALEAAYSHYYALVAVGIILFFTTVAYSLKHKGKSWLKGFLAMVVFLLCYSPWLFFLFTAMKNISSNWWMTDILGLDRSLKIVMGGNGFSTYIFFILIVLVIVLLVVESSLFTIECRGKKQVIKLQKPTVRNWSNETYGVMVGVGTIIGTLGFAYFLSYVMRPMLAERYMYPLSAVTIATLVVAGSRVFTLIKEKAKNIRWIWVDLVVKLLTIFIVVLFLIIGGENYNSYRAVVINESERTDRTLEIIGQPEKEIQMVSNGVQHLGWTVLAYYFPDNEVVNGDYTRASSDRFWYFSPRALDEGQICLLEDSGKEVVDYGEQGISKYSFYLYYIANIY